MNSWYVYALLSVIANSGMVLCLQKLKKNYLVDVYLFYIWTISAFILFIVFPPFNDIRVHYTVFPLIVVAGVCSWLGNLAYGNSLEHQPNSGFVESVSNVRVGLTYIISIFFFQSEFKVIRLLALFGIILGIILVSYSREQVTRIKINWISWALFSGFMFAGLAIVNKFAFMGGIAPTSATAGFFAIAASLYGATAIVRRHSLKLKNDIGFLILGGIFAAIGNIALFASYNLAPNLAYPVAISGSRMVLLFFVSAILFQKEKLNAIQSIGVLVTFISVIMLA